ncbi:MAG TPA: oligoribonuclease [Candidatus Babeliales bacterium]|nr:oligoribonuclease [Candidatus Babeliales bacterium]
MSTPIQPVTRLVWLDLELTGLDSQRDQILEIAVLITDINLNLIATGPCLALHQPAADLARMDEWNQRTHQQSGLLDLVRQSTITTAQAEAQVLAFVAQYCPPQTAPLCGNSIWQDRLFLVRLMPQLNQWLHYRIIDVSSIKVLVQNWYKPEKLTYTKKNLHRGLADIQETVAELRFYRQHFFVQE